MARYRYGNNYRLAFGKEVSYGTGATHSDGASPAVLSTRWDELIVVPDKVEFFNEDSVIQTGNKTQSGLASMCETAIGHQHRRVVMSGNLSHEHVTELLEAYGLEDSGAHLYFLFGIPATIPSYVIMRIWDDAPTGTPANKYTVQIAKGCQLTELKITGASGDLVKYEATFMAATVSEANVEQEITKDAISDPGTVCTEGFNFGMLIAAAVFGVPKHIKSFSLTLGSELADDATSFQNSNTRLAVIPTQMTGELNIVNNHDPDNVEDNKLLNEYLNRRKSLLAQIQLNNSKMGFDLTSCIQINSYTFADPDKGLFENNITGRLVNDPPDYPFMAFITDLT